MCVKFPPGDLKPGPYPPQPTSAYTCGVTTAPRVRGGVRENFSRTFRMLDAAYIGTFIY